MSGWIGVDLDSTLAYHAGGLGIGAPVPLMLARVQQWLAQGKHVKIMTARASVPSLIPEVEAWCLKHLGRVLEVTNQKDFAMLELWDDRAIQVVPNTGERVDGKQ